MINEIISLLEKKDRPFLSNIFYIISGIIMFAVLLLYILPFKFNVPLLNSIDIKLKLTNDELIVKITTIIVIVYIAIYVLRKILLRFSGKMDNNTFKNVFSNLYTIEDTLDFVASVFSVVFMFCVMVQFYKTSQFFTTKNAYFLYIFFGFKVSVFIIYKIYARNNSIINDVLKEYK